jgi:hypothetical protein
MPGFADSFWTPDYAAGEPILHLNPPIPPRIVCADLPLKGLGVLFSKLQQGVQENRQLLTIARMRAEAEDLYGQRLGDIAPAADKVAGGFSRDDGASVRKVRARPVLNTAREYKELTYSSSS